MGKVSWRAPFTVLGCIFWTFSFLFSFFSFFFHTAVAVYPVTSRWQCPGLETSLGVCRLVPAGCLQLCLQCF